MLVGNNNISRYFGAKKETFFPTLSMLLSTARFSFHFSKNCDVYTLLKFSWKIEKKKTVEEMHKMKTSKSYSKF